MIFFRYEECFALYKDIIKHSDDDFSDERETNLSAVIANLYMDGGVSRTTDNSPIRHTHIKYELPK